MDKLAYPAVDIGKWQAQPNMASAYMYVLVDSAALTCDRHTATEADKHETRTATIIIDICK